MDNKLYIEQNGSFVSFGHDKVSHIFEYERSSLDDEVKQYLQKIWLDPWYFNFATDGEKEKLEYLFKRYGYNLFKSLTLNDPGLDLYSFSSFHIAGKNDQEYHWELLHDGKNFCSTNWGITRVHQSKHANSSFSNMDVKHDLEMCGLDSLNVQKPVGSSMLECFPSNGINLVPLLFDRGFSSKVKFQSVKSLSRLSLTSILNNSSPQILIIAAYCLDEGIILYDSRSEKFEILPFYALATILKNATNRGLKGIIFRFWDYGKNLPADCLSKWFPETGLSFALEVRGLVAYDLAALYLKTFINFLAFGYNAAKACSKTGIKLYNNSPSRIWQPFFVCHLSKFYLEDKSSSGDASKKFNDSGILQKEISFWESKYSKIGFELDTNSSHIWIDKHLDKVDSKPIFLATDTFQDLSTIFYGWMLSRTKNCELSFMEIVSPFDQGAMRELTNLEEGEECSKFIADLWDNFIVININFPSAAKKIILLQDARPSDSNFDFWVSSKQKIGFNLVQILYNKAFATDPETLFFDVLPVSEVLQGYINSPELSKILVTKQSIFLSNSLWLRIWPAYDKDSWQDLLSLEKDEFFKKLIQALQSKLNPKLIAALSSLYIFKFWLVKKSWVELHELSSVEVDHLLQLKILEISLDGNQIRLNTVYLKLFSEFAFFSSEQILSQARRISLNMRKFVGSDARDLFLLSNNFLQVVSFYNGYKIALEFGLKWCRLLPGLKGYNSGQLLILGMNILTWGTYLSKMNEEDWGSKLWIIFFDPVIDQLPFNLALNLTKKVVDSFSRFEQWGGYSIALSVMAGLYHQKLELQPFMNLAKEAINTVKDFSKLRYFDVYSNLLKALISNTKLFEEFARNFEYDQNLIIGDKSRQKTISLVDLGYLLTTDSNLDILPAFSKLVKYDNHIYTQLDLVVGLKFLNFVKIKSKKHLTDAWRYLAQVSEKLNQTDIFIASQEYFYEFYLEKNDYKAAKKYALSLLIIAQNDLDLEKIKHWANNIAFLNFKEGGLKRAFYYSIANNPSKLYQL